MLRYCLDKWNKYSKDLEEVLKKDKSLNSCEYIYLVKMVVNHVLNGGCEDEYEVWDSEKITTVDNGDYQGTLLFLIPKKTYQPSEYEYLITYVGYGSCSGCDTLQAIQSWDDTIPTEQQLKDYMTLCRDLVCNIVKPYNSGWRNEAEFEVVEVEGIFE